MVNGTDSEMGLNEVAHKLATNRGFNHFSIFSERKRGLVELIGENASELWDVGEYSTITLQLTQTDDSPHLIAAYDGRLPMKYSEKSRKVREQFGHLLG